MLFLTAMGKRLFFDVIPKLEDTERERLRTSIAFRGLYQFFPLTGKGGKPQPIDCFSFGKETANPIALRGDYYANNGFELEEYKHKVDRRNPTDALLTLKPEGLECVEALVSAFDDLQKVSLDTLQHIAAAMGIKPSEDVVRPSPAAAVDDRYFSPFHAKGDNNLVYKLHRAIVERQALVDVTIRGDQRQGSAHTAPRVLRRKAAVADVTTSSASASSLAPLKVLGAPTLDDVSSPSSSSLLSHFDEQQLKGRLSADMPPIPDVDYSTISLLLPDLSGIATTSGTTATMASSSFSVPTPFEVYCEEKGTFEPIVLPLSFHDQGTAAAGGIKTIPMAVTSGLFLEKWTDGIIPATRYRERAMGDTHNAHIYQGLQKHLQQQEKARSASSPSSPSSSSSSATAPFNTQTALDRCNLTYYCVPNWDVTIDPFTADDDYDPNNRGGAAFVVGDVIPHE